MRSGSGGKVATFSGGVMQYWVDFMCSRFMRSLKEESMEPMDGGMFIPPSCSVPADRNLPGTIGNAWERMDDPIEAPRWRHPPPKMTHIPLKAAK